MIKIERLGKRYGAFTALENVSFGVRAAEIFGLVGPNGAGKTTLLKSLIGVVIPTEGRCYIQNICVQDNGVEARRRAGYLPSDGQFYESMTPQTFLKYALAGYPGVDAALRDELIDAFHIPIRKRIRSFSHGMKRKLGIITALAPQTPVAILDEPEEGLDPTARQIFLNILNRMRAAGKTILLSSHQLDSVAQVCDRVAFVAAGKLLDCDTIAGIRDRAGKRIRVRLQPGVDPKCIHVEGVESVVPRNDEYLVVASGDPLLVLRRLCALPIDGLEFRQLRLEEVYADLYQVERET